MTAAVASSIASVKATVALVTISVRSPTVSIVSIRGGDAEVTLGRGHLGEMACNICVCKRERVGAEDDRKETSSLGGISTAIRNGGRDVPLQINIQHRRSEIPNLQF